MRPLSPRENRLIAVAILFGAIGLVWLVAVRPVLDGFAERRDRRAQLTLNYQRGERMVASIPKLRRLVERQAPVRALFILPVASPEAARDYLKERLRAEFSAVGSDLRSTEDVDAADGLAAVAGEGELSLAELTRVVAHLQNTSPYLALDTLTVAANKGLVSGKLDTMDVKIAISIPYSASANR